MNPLTQIDFYKVDHRSQYPEGTELVYSNFTPRSDKHFGHWSDGKVVFVGLQAFIKEYLIYEWGHEFFYRPMKEVVDKYRHRIESALGKDVITYKHIQSLYKLGYLPIEIRALPEGSIVPIGVPLFTVHNTIPEFFWLTNYLETVISSENWKTTTTATIARAYRKIIDDAYKKTGGVEELLDFQCHDFSARGMSGRHDAAISGMGHLVYFRGTDSVSAIDSVEDHYPGDNGLVGASVPATEHSVMMMGEKGNEFETFKRLITEVYPTGVVSIVSDTWDFWQVITDFLPRLKKEIMARDGKVVIRPDSGDPVRILCGWSDDEIYYDGGGPFIKETDEWISERERKGAVECLWETFGGTTTEQGYKQLDSHIGLIYGDSITLDRADTILSRLADKGFASTNVVFGVGSYTYQYVTRDTLGFAMKATYGIVNGEPKIIFKDPKTDNGDKKSARGLLRVVKDKNGEYKLEDGFDKMSDIEDSYLTVVFKDGNLLKEWTFGEVRENAQCDW